MKHLLNQEQSEPFSKIDKRLISPPAGRKFFGSHKNYNSPEFVLSVETPDDNKIYDSFISYCNKSINSPTKKKSYFSGFDRKKEKEVQVHIDELSKLKEKLYRKDLELIRLRRMKKESFSNNRLTPPPFSNQMFDENLENKTKKPSSKFVLDPLPFINNNKSLSPTRKDAKSIFDVAQLSLLKNPRYSKNNPKIVLSNPITGIIPLRGNEA